MAEVYRNLMTKTWSVREGGAVTDHPVNLVVRNAKFVVQSGGRERVRKEKSKNVHAFVKGEISCREVDPIVNRHSGYLGWREVTYNPYRDETFVYADDHSPCLEADVVLMFGTRVWVRA